MNCSKIKLLAVAMLLTLSFNAQPVQAQFLKKLVKAAGKVLDTAASSSDSSSSSSGRSSSSSKSGKGKASNAYNSIDVSVTDAARFGNSVRVGFVMKNTSGKKLCVLIEGADFVCGGQSYELFAAKWGDYGLMYSSMSYGYEYIPENSQIKGCLFVKDVPKDVTSIDKIKLYADFKASSGNGYSFDISNGTECKTIPGIAIEPYKAANIEGSYSTYPDFTVDVNSFQRSGTTVTLSFTVTNGNKVSRVKFNDWKAYDENGTTYNISYGPCLKCKGEDVYSVNNLKFAPNASATFSLEIKNVPTSVKSFSMIRIPLQDVDLDDGITSSLFDNMLVLRNLSITEAPKATSVNKTTSTAARRSTATRTVRRTTTRR